MISLILIIYQILYPDLLVNFSKVYIESLGLLMLVISLKLINKKNTKKKDSEIHTARIVRRMINELKISSHVNHFQFKF